MTPRLFMVMTYLLLEAAFVIAALVAKDEQKRQTRLLWAIWFATCSIAKVLGAIAIHTGAFPLWNNK